MSRYSRNRIVPAILIVLIVIIAVVALVSLARAMFFKGDRSSKQTVQQTNVNRDALLNTSADRAVEMTVRGPIVADENFNSLRVVITPSSRTLTTYRGYLDTPIDTINLGNNVSAYTEFVHALDRANFTAGTPFEGEKDNTNGICASGRVYDYKTLQDNKPVMRLWTTTCKGSQGSLQASSEQLTNLFLAQIPDAQAALDKINY